MTQRQRRHRRSNYKRLNPNQETKTMTEDTSGHDQLETETRAALVQKFGPVYDTEELQRSFVVLGFSAYLCIVERRSDSAKGSLDYNASPRFYHSFQKST